MRNRTPNFDLYWLSKGKTHALTEELPNQAIPSKRKDKKWKEITMDTLEYIGVRQLHNDNKRFLDYYRMYNGDMSYLELSEVIPQLREIDQMLKDIEIPTFLKHYDLLGTIVNAFVGWFTQYDDKYTVTSTDEVEQNAYLREKKEQLGSYIKNSLDTEINIRLMGRGINPFAFNEVESEEERAQLMEQIQAEKKAMTPPEIQSFVDTNWKSSATKWGDVTLKYDRERFYMDELDKENMIDFCLTGRCFRHHRVGFDTYKPENWSPKNTFFSKTLNTKHVQYGEYVGRVDYLTPGQFVARYGHKMTRKQQDEVINGMKNSVDSNIPNSGPGGHPFAGRTIPYAGYDDHVLLTSVEDMFGIPMGVYEEETPNGETRKGLRFLPRSFSGGYRSDAQSLRDDITLRNDIVQVTEAYWVSYKLMFYICYETETGMVTQDIVTDELAKEFLKDKGITKVKQTLEEFTDNPEVNTYIEYYIPEVWYGVKGRFQDKQRGDDLYLYCEPIEYQIPGESNFYDYQLPVTGLVTESSLAEKTYADQVGHNIAMNQLINLLEKEIGIFFLFDISLLPTEYKELGGKDALDSIMDVAKSLSIFGMDMSKQNVSGTGGTPFNQFSAVDLTLTKQIQSRIQLAEFYKNNLFQKLGLTPQALGTPINYETAEGVKQGMNASLVQLQIYGDNFDIFKKRTLDQHLAVAQYCQKNNKDTSLMYIQSDLTRSYLYLSDPDIPLCKLNIFVLSNSKKRKELEQYKARLLQLNTTGADELALAKIIASDDILELKQVALETRNYQEEQRQIEFDRQSQLNQQQSEYLFNMDELKHNREKELLTMKIEGEISKARVTALGRAADKQSDARGIQEINRAAELDIERTKTDSDIEISNREQDRKELKDANDFKLKMESLKQSSDQLMVRRQEDQTKRITSAINKN